MVVGVFLVIIGVAILVFGGFTDTTTREEVKIGLQIPPPSPTQSPGEGVSCIV